MGFNELSNDGEGGYALFEDGDNVIAKPSKISCDVSTYKGDFQGYEIMIDFDAVEEVDEEDRGRIPYWPNSKITIQDNEELTSNLAKLLKIAGVTEDVLRDLGADDELVESVKSGGTNFSADSVDENQELAKALVKHLGGKVFRISTKQRSDSDGEPTYSMVDRVVSISDKESLFEGFEVDIDLNHPEHGGGSESGGDAEDISEESSEDKDSAEVIFDDEEDVE